MRHTFHLVLALSLAVPLAACGEKNAAEPGSNKSTMGALAEKAGEMKDSAMKMFDGQLGDASKSIEELKSKAASATGNTKAEIDALLEKIKAKKDEVVKMIQEHKGDGSSLDALKTKVGEGLASIKKMVEEGLAKLK